MYRQIRWRRRRRGAAGRPCEDLNGWAGRCTCTRNARRCKCSTRTDRDAPGCCSSRALLRRVGLSRARPSGVRIHSDAWGEFGERCRDTPMRARADRVLAEFVACACESCITGRTGCSLLVREPSTRHDNRRLPSGDEAPVGWTGFADRARTAVQWGNFPGGGFVACGGVSAYLCTATGKCPYSWDALPWLDGGVSGLRDRR
jgi:hypothetical protein